MINKFNKWLDNLTMTQEQQMQSLVSDLDVKHTLESLQGALNSTIDHGGSNCVQQTINALNSLLALNLTSCKHDIYLMNTPITISFDHNGKLVSMVQAKALPLKHSKHLNHVFS